MPPGSVHLAFLRVVASDAFGSARVKLACVLHASNGADRRTRAAAANHKAPLLSSVFSGAHVVFEVGDVAELAASDIAAKLIASGGAHAASSFRL